MPVDRDQLSEWVERCKVDEPLLPGDERYVDLQGLRGEDHMLPIQDCILLKKHQSCQLFSGFNGTGKSTELRRLTKLLRTEGYVVLFANAMEYHDLYHPLAIEELLVIIAGAFGEATAEVVGKDVIKDGYWSRLRAFLNEDAQVDQAKIPLVDLKVSIAHGQPLWLKIRDQLSASLGKLRSDTHGFIQQCIKHISRKQAQAKGVVFIFDSLERLRGTEDRFRATMDSAIKIFTQYSSFLHLPGCHVVYTVPPYMNMLSSDVASRYDRPLHVLPSVKVLEKGSEVLPHQPGVQGLCELVGKRIPLEQVFGDDLQWLEALAINSGGHLKTLIAFVRELLIRALRTDLPVTGENTRRVLQSFSETVEQSVRSEGALLLESVLADGRLDSVKDEQLPLLARYMDTQVVLCYRNGGGWYEVHPLVRDHVRRLASESRSREP